MHRTVKVVLSLCWAAVFGALAMVTMTAAVDGIAAAREAMPFAIPLLGIDPLASQQMMGGISLGAAIVTSLFAWMLVTALLVEDQGGRGAGNPVEIAHGGAFGMVGIVMLATMLDASLLLTTGSALLAAALVVSLMLSRMVPEPGPTLAPRSVRDRAIEAAHVYSVDMRQQSAELLRTSGEVVPFPLRGEFARGVQ